MTLKRTAKHVACVVVAVLVLISLWLAIFDGPLVALSSPAELWLRVLFGAVGLTLLFFLVRALSNRSALTGPGRPTPDNPSDGDLDVEVQRSIDLVNKKYKGNQAKALFSKLLLDTRLLTRAYENAELLDQTLLLKTSIDYSLAETLQSPAGADSLIVPVPVIEVRKGTLLDSFEVLDRSGGVMPTLPQAESRGLLAHAIITCFAGAYGHALASLLTSTSRPEALKQLLRMVYKRGRTTDQASGQQFAAATSGLTLGSGPSATRFASRLQKLCIFYARHYVVAVDIAVVEPANRIYVEYRQAAPIYGMTDSWRGKVRARFGLSPYKFMIPMPLMYRAASYHLSMRGLNGQYASNHAVMPIGSKVCIGPTEMGSWFAGCYLRLRYRTGLPYARLYARGFQRVARDKQQPLVSVVEFAEVPPGALGGAGRVALVTAILVALFAFLRPAVTEVSSDAAALLLAAPAAMAAWVGYSIDRVRQSSLATYVGLATTQLVSVASAVLYLTERRNSDAAAQLLTLHKQRLIGLFTLPDMDVGWLFLSIVAGVVAISLISLRMIHTRRYLQEVERWNVPD